MSIVDILKRIRNELKLSQEQLARDIDVSHATLNRWENGHNAPSRLAKKELARYCKKKGVSEEIIDELYRS
ncbi:MAG: helix-turn-helix transcriptional regulator [Lachnospiraceae bacterium]|nr:helix-turn-helix transcriptional regulator [Lachnospiraceae bacterium]